MSDIADDSQQQVDDFIRHAIATKKPAGPEFTGRCANCNEPVEAPKRWCDEACREDWQHRSRRT